MGVGGKSCSHKVMGRKLIDSVEIQETLGAGTFARRPNRRKEQLAPALLVSELVSKTDSRTEALKRPH